MRYTLPAIALSAIALTAAAAIGAPQMGKPSADLKAAVATSTRTPANVARDKYRNPAETLAFFGVKPSHTVVELWPGGGWYTEILAPYVKKGGGTLYAAAPWPNGVKGTQTLQAKNPELYGAVKLAAFPTADDAPIVPAGSADVVLTFRNVHNWKMGTTDRSAEAFKQIFEMLKPGGTLGIVEHRLPESADSAREKTSGYVKVSTVRKLAEDAGFKFVAASEVNANPKDTADWKDGVWTLPPVLRLKEVDRAKYEAIGESDRMTLKFRKPNPSVRGG